MVSGRLRHISPSRSLLQSARDATCMYQNNIYYQCLYPTSTNSFQRLNEAFTIKYFSLTNYLGKSVNQTENFRIVYRPH